MLFSLSFNFPTLAHYKAISCSSVIFLIFNTDEPDENVEVPPLPRPLSSFGDSFVSRYKQEDITTTPNSNKLDNSSNYQTLSRLSSSRLTNCKTPSGSKRKCYTNLNASLDSLVMLIKGEPVQILTIFSNE